MKRFDPIITGVILITLVILGGILLAAFKTSNKSTSTKYNVSDAERPKMQISEKEFDLGNVSSSEQTTKEITLANTGVRALETSNFSTSCDCTSVIVEIDGEKSPKFSMHTNSSWKGTIEPGKTAKLTIIYDPRVMQVKGEIERVVYFKTNDPETTDVQINFKAFVEK